MNYITETGQVSVILIRDCNINGKMIKYLNKL